MREIKFRVWNGKKFLNSYKGKGLSFSAGNDSQMEEFGCYDLEQCLDLGFNVQQFTGLRDKNGKEIYEGDIVICDNPYSSAHPTEKEKGVVTYDKAVFWLLNKAGHWYFDLNPEVIGNIFENPELL